MIVSIAIYIDILVYCPSSSVQLSDTSYTALVEQGSSFDNYKQSFNNLLHSWNNIACGTTCPSINYGSGLREAISLVCLAKICLFSEQDG